ncbi:MAG: hypothetical protein LBK29_04030, partial [Oscillospiraceae bacterium]|nr:hypothetical protein [Oscillospiraceae bacterium]
LSLDQPNQWLLFDLKGKFFKIEQIRIQINSFLIGRNWTLEGSNDNSKNYEAPNKIEMRKGKQRRRFGD